jgi:L-fuconolactonase
MRIDSHQHFWRYNPEEHVWMDDRMSAIKRDFLPEDLAPLLAAVEFDGSIAVQARQTVEETGWLLELSDHADFILGVVGWIDLCSSEVPSQLKRFAGHPKLRGVRHVIHDEQDDQFVRRPDFRRGIELLREFDLTYDLLLYPRHLPIAISLVEALPDQPFVLDHIGKPAIRDGQITSWKQDLEALAGLENVSCKLSGMVTESEWGRWQPEDFRRYLDIVFEAFGADRVMIGSDWPVCALSGAYQSVMSVVIDYCRQFPAEVGEAVLGGNCAAFYGLSKEKGGG